MHFLKWVTLKAVRFYLHTRLVIANREKQEIRKARRNWWSVLVERVQDIRKVDDLENCTKFVTTCPNEEGWILAPSIQAAMSYLSISRATPYKFSF